MGHYHWIGLGFVSLERHTQARVYRFSHGLRLSFSAVVKFCRDKRRRAGTYVYGRTSVNAFGREVVQNVARVTEKRHNFEVFCAGSTAPDK